MELLASETSLNLGANPLARLSGYDFRHVPAHLNATGRHGDLHRLLQLEFTEIEVRGARGRRRHNAWFHAREAFGDEARYLADVRLAWDIAQAETQKLNRAGSVARSVGLETRYALYQASLNSLATNIPPGLLVALVARGLWNESRALGYVRQIPDERVRTEAVVGLASNLREPDVRAAVELAEGIEDEALRAEVLIALGHHSGDDLFRVVVDVARALRSDTRRARVMTSLAPRIAQLPIVERLQLLSSVRNPAARADAIRAFGAHASESGAEEFLDLALRIRSPTARFEALDGLSGHLREPLASDAAQKAAEAAEKIRDPRQRALALARVGDLRGASRAAATIVALDDRREAKVVLATHRRAGLKPRVAVDALRMRSPAKRANAVRHLAPLLTWELLPDVLKAVFRFQSGWMTAEALRDLAPHLSEPLFEGTLAAVQELRHEWERVLPLEALAAPHTPPALVPKAREMIRAIPITDTHSGRPLRALIPRLAECGYHSESLRSVSDLRSGRQRGKALAESARHLPKPMLERALELAESIRSTSARAEALGAIAGRLDPDALHSALADLRSIGDQDSCLQTMASFAPFVRETMLEEAFVAARRVTNQARRAQSLVQVARHLPDGLFAEAEHSVGLISDENARDRALADIALGKVDGGDCENGLRIARDVSNETRRADLLVRLAPTLPRKLLREAFADARSLVYDAARAEALAALAQRVPGAQRQAAFEEALAAAQSISSDGRPRAPEEYRAAIEHILEFVDAADLLREISVSLPAGDSGFDSDDPWRRADEWATEQLRATTLATVGSRMAQSGYANDARAAAEQITWEYARAKALAGLLHYSSERVRVDLARECIRTAVQTAERGSAICFYPTWVSVRTIAEVAAEVPRPLIDEAIAAIDSITQRWPADVEHEPGFVEALRQVGLTASPRMLQEALPNVPDLVARLGRVRREEGLVQMCLAQAKVRLSAKVPVPRRGTLRRQALAEATAIVNEEARARAIATLAPFLPDWLVSGALDAIRAIGYERSRAEALVGLAPYLGTTGRMGDAVAIALRIEQVSHRIDALAAVARVLAGAEIPHVNSLWIRALDGEAVLPFAARRTRASLLADLRGLGAIIELLGASEAAAESFRAVDDVAAWWP